MKKILVHIRVWFYCTRLRNICLFFEVHTYSLLHRSAHCIIKAVACNFYHMGIIIESFYRFVINTYTWKNFLRSEIWWKIMFEYIKKSQNLKAVLSRIKIEFNNLTIYKNNKKKTKFLFSFYHSKFSLISLTQK